MKILGIADNHDSAAALAIDGQLVAAVNQERIDRTKGSSAFPWGAIDAVLKHSGVKAGEIDRIVVGTSFTPSAILRLFPRFHQQAKSNGQFSPLLHGYMVYQSALRKAGLENLEIETCRRILQRRLRARPFRQKLQLEMMDHHLAHAHSAYRSQEHDRCLVLTLDAMGDGTTTSAWLGENATLQPLGRQSGLAAINLFYSRITEYLGFRALRHEGKITGLAALAEAPPELLAHMRQQVAFTEGRFVRMRIRTPARRGDTFWSFLQAFSREQVAAAAQCILEESCIAYVQHWVEQSGCPHLAVAGGVFANVKLNQRIAQLPEVRSLWVVPHMGDGGLAMGAALGATNAPPAQLRNAYLGPDLIANDIYRALQRGNVSKDKVNPIEKAADILCQGGVVARCKGGMEWGPRALGNRSIFALPNDPSINERLNERLSRSEFMPFAPIIRARDAHRYFRGIRKAQHAARFMTVCFEATDGFKKACPAAVHVDGTARPQLLRKFDNPEVYDLLTAVGKRCGTPVLINTSFNLHEEPIVCTADDAVRAFRQAKLEGLLIGDVLGR